MFCVATFLNRQFRRQKIDVSLNLKLGKWTQDPKNLAVSSKMQIKIEKIVSQFVSLYLNIAIISILKYSYQVPTIRIMWDSTDVDPVKINSFYARKSVSKTENRNIFSKMKTLLFTILCGTALGSFASLFGLERDPVSESQQREDTCVYVFTTNSSFSICVK